MPDRRGRQPSSRPETVFHLGLQARGAEDRADRLTFAGTSAILAS